jgi:hypothetical protein
MATASIDNAKLLEEARWVILLCDQANTNNVLVERLGSRGLSLVKAVNDLRKVITDAGLDPWGVGGGEWSVGHGPVE